MKVGKASTRLMATVGMGMLFGVLAIAGVGVMGTSQSADAQGNESRTEGVNVIWGEDDDFDALANKVEGRNVYVEGVAREGVETERATTFPYQYWTFAVEKTRDGLPVGHSTSEGKVEGPWVRYFGGGQPVYDEEGHMLISNAIWDKATGTWRVQYPDDMESYGFSARCFSCKSVMFNEMYEEYGSDAFGMVMTQDVMEVYTGEVWGCGSCHEDPENPTSEVDSQHIFFNTIIGDDGDELSAGEKVCGQCHNQTFFTSKCTDDEYFQTEKPFRYGFDADALIQQQIEDGMIWPDEYGIYRAGGMHGDLEIFQNSVHDSLGMDCTTCHMPKMTAEDGTVFTDHDASQSPLENSAALEVCLSCHKDQGIEDADAMIAMVRAKQDEAGARENELRDEVTGLVEAVTLAVQSGEYDEETLDTLRYNIFVADFYVEYCQGSGSTTPGIKVVHNPKGIEDYLNRAEKIIDDSYVLLDSGKTNA